MQKWVGVGQGLSGGGRLFINYYCHACRVYDCKQLNNLVCLGVNNVDLPLAQRINSKLSRVLSLWSSTIIESIIFSIINPGGQYRSDYDRSAAVLEDPRSDLKKLNRSVAAILPYN